MHKKEKGRSCSRVEEEEEDTPYPKFVDVGS